MDDEVSRIITLMIQDRKRCPQPYFEERKFGPSGDHFVC